MIFSLVVGEQASFFFVLKRACLVSLFGSQTLGTRQKILNQSSWLMKKNKGERHGIILKFVDSIADGYRSVHRLVAETVFTIITISLLFFCLLL